MLRWSETQKLVIRKRIKTTSCCSCQTFKSRRVSSGPVALVLIMTTLVAYATGCFFQLGDGKSDLITSISPRFIKQSDRLSYSKILVGVLLWSFAGLVSAWLAGWKYKLTGIISIGLVVMGISVFLDNILSAVIVGTGTSKTSTVVVVLNDFNDILLVLGVGSVFNNLVQLAIEQVPEASGSQLSSLISWSIFSTTLGFWLGMNQFSILADCFLTSDSSSYEPVTKLTVSCSMAICLILYFLFKHKLVDNSLPSNTVRQIYEVLKYAYKHKFPQRRSAMTYWEDAPVSRLNLGKTKYGGPFTNEQVEDVKTFLRVSLLFFGVMLYLECLYLHGHSVFYIDNGVNNSLSIVDSLPEDNCTKSVIHTFSVRDNWWMMVFAIVYELILIPVWGYRMPNILHRLTIVGVAVVPLVLADSAIITVNSFSLIKGSLNLFAYQVMLSLCIGVLKSSFYITGLEFICAQVPYTMRNYFITIALSSSWSFPVLTSVLFDIFEKYCESERCSFYYMTTCLAMCFVSFATFLRLIKTYRRRSRGQEDEHQQRWVEEVYGRYVTENISDIRQMNSISSMN